jgi:sugar/nucleoside kinase (ribokinase family)
MPPPPPEPKESRPMEHASAATPCELIIVGSVGIDTIETPREKRERILGGSASYACAAASFYVKTGMVGVVGTDFPAAFIEQYRSFGIDLGGLQIAEGKTFHWSGVYEQNMDNRRTLATDLNVFAAFSPELPEPYRSAPFLFLANISPELQLHVLDQIAKPRFVLLDTMDLWINVAKDALVEVIGKVTMLTLNESEARHLTGEHNLVRAAGRLLRMGPKYVVIKKGEHGSVLFSKKGIAMMPAFPLEDVQDPTGAGDTFAGGFIGALARGGVISEAAIRKAMTYGSVTASFGVEQFSLDRLATLRPEELEARAALFRKMGRIQ